LRRTVTEQEGRGAGDSAVEILRRLQITQAGLVIYPSCNGMVGRSCCFIELFVLGAVVGDQ